MWFKIQSQSVASSTSHAVSSSFNSFWSASFTQTQGDQLQHPSASTVKISVPSFVPTFCTYSNPIFGVPSIAPPASSQPSRVGVGVALSFPAIFNSAPLVERDFVIGPGYYPIPNKLVSKIINGQFVELVDLLPDNLKSNKTETQTFLDGKLVVTSTYWPTVEIQDVLTWVEAFTIYSLVLCASQPLRWADLSQYKLLIIRRQKSFQGEHGNNMIEPFEMRYRL